MGNEGVYKPNMISFHNQSGYPSVMPEIFFVLIHLSRKLLSLDFSLDSFFHDLADLSETPNNSKRIIAVPVEAEISDVQTGTSSTTDVDISAVNIAERNFGAELSQCPICFQKFLQKRIMVPVAHNHPRRMRNK